MNGETPAPITSMRANDIGVISAARLAGVLLSVLIPLAAAMGFYVHTQVERAVLMNNAIMAERYVTKQEQEALKAELNRRLEEIQRQLEKANTLAQKVAIRLKVEP